MPQTRDTGSLRGGHFIVRTGLAMIGALTDHPLERWQRVDDAFSVATRQQARVENDDATVVAGTADQTAGELRQRA